MKTIISRLDDWWNLVLLGIMVRIARYLGFHAVTFFSPGQEKNPMVPVRAIHFAQTEYWLERSIYSYRTKQ